MEYVCKRRAYTLIYYIVYSLVYLIQEKKLCTCVQTEMCIHKSVMAPSYADEKNKKSN